MRASPVPADSNAWACRVDRGGEWTKIAQLTLRICGSKGRLHARTSQDIQSVPRSEIALQKSAGEGDIPDSAGEAENGKKREAEGVRKARIKTDPAPLLADAKWLEDLDHAGGMPAAL